MNASILTRAITSGQLRRSWEKLANAAIAQAIEEPRMTAGWDWTDASTVVQSWFRGPRSEAEIERLEDMAETAPVATVSVWLCQVCGGNGVLSDGGDGEISCSCGQPHGLEPWTHWPADEAEPFTIAALAADGA